MRKSLLSHIAGSFISQYENVANSSICYLLNNYPAAKAALEKSLSLEERPARYETEKGEGKFGRPDITGIDEQGANVVIIEGKFWANLTDNQPNSYLQTLKTKGKVLFLVPEKRIVSITIELDSRVVDQALRQRIEVRSWGEFLQLLELENSKKVDFQLESDIAQLKALCGRMDEEGMPPLSQSDLDPMNGRITYQLADLLDDCREQIRQWEESNLTGSKASAWKLGYGFYFRAFGFGCQLYFSSYRWFTDKSQTPIWLTVADEEYNRSNDIFRALAIFDNENAYDDNGCAAYAVLLKPGLDKHQSVDHIVQKVRDTLKSISEFVESRK